MTKTVVVEIAPREEGKSPAVQHVQQLLAGSGARAACSGVTTLYRLEGAASSAEVRRICNDVLCDPIVEKYSVDSRPESPRTLFADVWYKPGVTDAVGDSIVKAVGDIRIYSLDRAFSGTRYQFSIPSGPNGKESPEAAILDFVNKQLLNPLVQECKIQKL